MEQFDYCVSFPVRVVIVKVIKFGNVGKQVETVYSLQQAHPYYNDVHYLK